MQVSMSTILTETVTAVKSGKRFLVTIGVPGEGTSGKYSAELWEKYGSVAFPPGTRSYYLHDTPEKREPQKQLGKFEETFWNAEAGKFQGYLKPFSRWLPLLEEMVEEGDGIDMSISCGGTKDEDGNVLTLEYHRTNSVDAVGYAGLEGSRIESLVESAVSAFTAEPSTEPGAGDKETLMETQIADKISALTVAVEALLGKIDAKVQESAQIEADEAAAKAAATAAVEAYSANIVALEAVRGDLLPSQITALQESAKGTDTAAFTSAIETAKLVATEAKSAVLNESSAGRDFSSADVDFFMPEVRI